MVHDERGPVSRSALSRCLSIDTESFAERYWGQRPLLSRTTQTRSDFSDLFSLDAVDELVSARALRTPFVRMAKEGEVLAPARFTAPGGYGAEIGDQLNSEKVLAEFADGATLVLQGLHRTWAPITEFARALGTELGRPCQVNAYITPASSRGFDPHYDVHDVFVLQIHGRKHWRIHTPVYRDPLPDQPWTDHRAAVAERAAEQPAIDDTFEPGDALYFPRGWIHSATAEGGISIHLTIGISPATRHDVVRALVARAADVERLRASLPMGLDWAAPDAGRELVEQTARELVAELQASIGDAPAICERIATQLGSRLPSAPLRPLRTIESIDAMDGDTLVVLREGLQPTIAQAQTTVTLAFAGTSVTLPAAAAPALQRLLEGGPTRVSELPELDRDSAIVVARRLVREGVLVVL